MVGLGIVVDLCLVVLDDFGFVFFVWCGITLGIVARLVGYFLFCWFVLECLFVDSFGF